MGERDGVAKVSQLTRDWNEIAHTDASGLVLDPALAPHEGRLGSRLLLPP